MEEVSRVSWFHETNNRVPCGQVIPMQLQFHGHCEMGMDTFQVMDRLHIDGRQCHGLLEEEELMNGQLKYYKR